MSSGSTVSSVSSSPSYSGGDYGSRSVSGGRDFGMGSSSFSRGTLSRGYAPPPPPKTISTTSFCNAGNYYQWMDFYHYLQMRYFMMGGLYGGMYDSYYLRFLRNREPLLTPQLMKLTTQDPLRYSSQMLVALDELEAMLQTRQSGGTVSKEDIALKAQEIRDLAKKIRQDPALPYIDQRKDKDILKGSDAENLGLEAVGQLRELITDLHTQLKSMYVQNTTSTVSVSSLTQPSLESLSKGIEKLSRVIENSAKKI